MTTIAHHRSVDGKYCTVTGQSRTTRIARATSGTGCTGATRATIIARFGARYSTGTAAASTTIGTGCTFRNNSPITTRSTKNIEITNIGIAIGPIADQRVHSKASDHCVVKIDINALVQGYRTVIEHLGSYRIIDLDRRCRRVGISGGSLYLHRESALDTLPVRRMQLGIAINVFIDPAEGARSRTVILHTGQWHIAKKLVAQVGIVLPVSKYIRECFQLFHIFDRN
ncbi:hypothetical protein D3H65_11880 [Paraflavitalea soli]|uniref:Uncharacterized protein n=1 Tax=Paraflavitalea soli TaxID=2315862 RepID=A0A3B7MLP1_9BACT|nr:hypothetical protein D3H65_11880 [Paraflavitalea soli]